jgi:hypothetical protein
MVSPGCTSTRLRPLIVGTALAALASVLMFGCGASIANNTGDGGTHDGGTTDGPGSSDAACGPASCASLGANCGEILTCDVDTTSINCGTCPPPLTCGGGGVPNVCGNGTCNPTTCAALGWTCGVTSDQCGGVLHCGSCIPPATCGGGGVPGQCGDTCMPTTCAALGLACGEADNGCAGLLHCGTCAAPESCGGGGVPGQCGVTAETHVAGGGLHTCAVTLSGGVKCWGSNQYGQIGDGTTDDRHTPVPVVGLQSGVVAVAVGASHSCALTAAGDVKCWGSNQYGQVGDSTTTDRTTPVAVIGLVGVPSAIASGGRDHTCVLTSAGGAQCWGLNDHGQLGDGTTTNRGTLVPVLGLASGVAAVAARGQHTCAIAFGGDVFCWGWNGNGQLGDDTTTDHATPVAVSGLPGNAVAIATGGSHSCAVATTGQLYCWGYNLFGQLGDASTTDRHLPVAVQQAASTAAISSRNAHTCLRTSAGQVKCFGSNQYGQIGDGTNTDAHVPTAVTGLPSGAELAPGAYHTCAWQNGTVWCWGRNDHGQLGDDTTTDRNTAAQVAGF